MQRASWAQVALVAVVSAAIGAATVRFIVDRQLRMNEVRLLGHGYWEIFEMQLNRPGFWESRAHHYRLYRYRLDLGQTGGPVTVAADGSASWTDIMGQSMHYDPKRDRVDTLATRPEIP